jgi:acyl-coenzyme A synthetase/AMP-(fatty) acid ligase
MSPRNSAAAVIDMMEKTKCSRLITTQHSLGSLIDAIKADFVCQGAEMGQLHIDEVPALKDLYPALVSNSPNEAAVPYPRTSRPSKDDILLYLHSSGSTGFPKPIPMTNISAIHWCLTRKS